MGAKETGRNYVGAEIDEKYYKIALERLRNPLKNRIIQEEQQTLSLGI